MFLNTSIRRHQKENVTAKYRLLDVQPYFPGERTKTVGENSRGWADWSYPSGIYLPDLSTKKLEKSNLYKF